MKRSRRDFIRTAGLLAAAALAARCGRGPGPTATPLMPGCYIQVTVPQATLPPNENWSIVRKCWYALDDPRAEPGQDETFRHDLVRRHQDALQVLRTRGELKPEVAALIGAAFTEAVEHIPVPRPSGVLCYRMVIPRDQWPARDVWQQATALEEMEARSHVDPETVELARAALEHDMAWLTRFKSGEMEGWAEPEDVEVDPVSAEAARILVELLVGGGG